MISPKYSRHSIYGEWEREMKKKSDVNKGTALKFTHSKMHSKNDD